MAHRQVGTSARHTDGCLHGQMSRPTCTCCRQVSFNGTVARVSFNPNSASQQTYTHRRCTSTRGGQSVDEYLLFALYELEDARSQRLTVRILVRVPLEEHRAQMSPALLNRQTQQLSQSLPDLAFRDHFVLHPHMLFTPSIGGLSPRRCPKRVNRPWPIPTLKTSGSTGSTGSSSTSLPPAESRPGPHKPPRHPGPATVHVHMAVAVAAPRCSIRHVLSRPVHRRSPHK
mmetsp:Transcript_29719/g.73950  ORF Transcript_29719/g.73950 Transcript_29719/m.73950 type:complete len:229 (+) Transcript_29719:343-1029(+)